MLMIHRKEENPYSPDTEFFEIYNFFDYDELAYQEFLSKKSKKIKEEDDDIFPDLPKENQLKTKNITPELETQEINNYFSALKKLASVLFKDHDFTQLKISYRKEFDELWELESRLNTGDYYSQKELEELTTNMFNIWKKIEFKANASKRLEEKKKKESDEITSILESIK